jgi:hypothetical protein
MKQEPQNYDDDDGRVIVNMDVEGMPWHNQRLRREKRAARAGNPGDQLTNREARLYTWNAVLAGLLIVGVFSLALVLFTLFCTEIWFR